MSSTPFSINKFRIIYIGCWLIWLVLQAWVLYWYGFTYRAALTDSCVSNVLLSAICLLVGNMFQYYLPSHKRYVYLFAVCTLMALIWFVISRFLLMLLLGKNAGYHSFFNESVPVRIGIAFLIIGCMALLSVLWYTLQNQQENDKRKTDMARLAKEAELYKLRQQLQPHFLFNSLNSINALIGFKPDEARLMIQQLSDFLRGTLKKEEQQWVSLTEELYQLELYLSIEKVRFGHRLTTLIESSENNDLLKMPPMLLQPIVENAIKFGLYDTTEVVTIKITATVVETQLIITVQNPFDAETSSPQAGTGFGLSSVQRRLYLLFARKDLLQTDVENNLFTTTITIPQPV